MNCDENNYVYYDDIDVEYNTKNWNYADTYYVNYAGMLKIVIRNMVKIILKK